MDFEADIRRKGGDHSGRRNAWHSWIWRDRVRRWPNRQGVPREALRVLEETVSRERGKIISRSEGTLNGLGGERCRHSLAPPNRAHQQDHRRGETCDDEEGCDTCEYSPWRASRRNSALRTLEGQSGFSIRDRCVVVSRGKRISQDHTPIL